MKSGEWRNERLKVIRKILRELQKMLKAIGNLQKESIAKVKENMYKDAKQKVFGLGYNLLVFVYDKADDPKSKTATLNFVSCSFVLSLRKYTV